MFHYQIMYHWVQGTTYDFMSISTQNLRIKGNKGDEEGIVFNDHKNDKGTSIYGLKVLNIHNKGN